MSTSAIGGLSVGIAFGLIGVSIPGALVVFVLGSLLIMGK